MHQDAPGAAPHLMAVLEKHPLIPAQSSLGVPPAPVTSQVVIPGDIKLREHIKGHSMEEPQRKGSLNPLIPPLNHSLSVAHHDFREPETPAAVTDKDNTKAGFVISPAGNQLSVLKVINSITTDLGHTAGNHSRVKISPAPLLDIPW